jgi:hypothetical protein
MKTIARQLGVTKFPFKVIDKIGNLIYIENSHGYWAKWERDEQGNGIYFEDSDNYWSKSEYDSNGYEVYYENSEGEIIDTRPKTQPQPEPQPEPMTIEINGKRFKLTEI